MFPRRVLLASLIAAATTAFSPSGRVDVRITSNKCSGCHGPLATLCSPSVGRRRNFASPPMHLFGKDKEDSNVDDAEKVEKSNEKTGGKFPFFERFSRSAQQNTLEKTDEGEGEEKETLSTTVSATAEPEKPSIVSTKNEQVPPSNDPADVAKALRAQAEMVRLQAELLDAELSLQKLARLERELEKAQAKGKPLDELERQINDLMTKSKKVPGAAETKPETKALETDKIGSKSAESTAATDMREVDDSINTSISLSGLLSTDKTCLTLTQEDFEKVAKKMNQLPEFMKVLLARVFDVDVFDEQGERKPINSTAVAERIVMALNGDFSYSSLPKPSFTQKMIEEEAEKFKNDSWEKLEVSNEMIELADGNVTQLALYGLEYDYYVLRSEKVNDIIQENDILSFFNRSSVDAIVDIEYPKCLHSRDNAPTLAQVELFISTVLPKVKFATSSKPEPVLGGFIIRGNHNYEKGDDLIAEIDRQIARTSLGDKLTVLYAEDFTKAAKIMEGDEDEFMELLLEPQENILFVVGPEITREPKRVALSLTSSIGLATSWYLALYPFLLNPDLAKRIDEQLALADASMAYDLDWLTELSVPLFVTFVGLQFAHEAGHNVVAGFYNMTTTTPTFVPSLVTGITSAVTTFKKPPMNKDQMFDWSIAGPLTGLLASLAALAIGSTLTLSSDPSILPGLPLEILRQSTLGGTIINSILGNGALNIPDGAVGTQAVSTMIIPLHPVAIAGFISLFINALSLLPIGTTDGGRIATTLFGRSEKSGVGFIALAALLLAGLAGSDLFLFYFAFVIAFQSGNEIPARNEADNVSFSRVLLAIAGTVLSLLVLVPFQ